MFSLRDRQSGQQLPPQGPMGLALLLIILQLIINNTTLSIVIIIVTRTNFNTMMLLLILIMIMIILLKIIITLAILIIIAIALPSCGWLEWVGKSRTTNLRTKTLEFAGFDSSTISSLRGGIPGPTGNLPEMLSQQILAGIFLVGRLGVPVSVK